MSLLAQVSVTRLRAGAVSGFDPHGDADGWDSPTRLVLTECSVQPGSPGPEVVGNRDTTSVVWTVYALGEVDVLATDRIELPGGSVYEVEGEPQRWAQGLALPPMTVILLRRWDELHG